MGFLLVGILLIGLTVFFITKWGESLFYIWVPTGIIGAVTVLLIFALMLEANVMPQKNYQEQYENYITLSKCVEVVEVDKNSSLYEDVVEYNSLVYGAKHEGFMTKWCHNPLYKQLPYIEGTGIDLSEN